MTKQRWNVDIYSSSAKKRKKRTAKRDATVIDTANVCTEVVDAHYVVEYGNKIV